jgi:hypothetical protein
MSDKLEDAQRCAIIKLLRSEAPLDRYVRDLLSNELVTLWWPRKKQRQRDREAAWLQHERALIDYFAAMKHDAPAQAAAKALGFRDVEAMREVRKRYQKSARKK